MMRTNFLSLIALLCVNLSIAQVQDTLYKDSIEVINNLSKRIEVYERLMQQNDLRRKQDSLARVELMKQIQLLQETDKVTRASLTEQINSISRRDSIRQAQQKNQVIELRSSTLGIPVDPFKDTLFTIYTKLGPTKAEDRAKIVESKIESLVRGDVFYPDSLIIQENDITADIIYQGMIVTSVSDWDAMWVGDQPKLELAKSYAQAIIVFLETNRDRSSIQNVFARIGLVFLIIGTALLIMYFLSKLIDGIQGWMIVHKKKYFNGIRIGTYEFLPPKRQLDVSLRLVGIAKWALYALVAYLSLPVIFGIFPFTKGWAETLLDWILNPVKDIWGSFWSYLPNFFTLTVIVIITRYVIKFLRFIALEVELGNLRITGFHADWAVPTYRLGRVVIYAFMFVVIYPYLPGSDTAVFKGVSIFMGLLIALGSIATVGNAIAGLGITYMRPFQMGDRVKIGEVEGVILGKTLLVTRIRTTKNEDITVPNSKILTGHTINYTKSSSELGLILHTSIKINAKVPWRKVHEILVEAAVATDGVNISREPFVLQKSIEGAYVKYELNAFTDVPDRMDSIYSDLHASIQDKFGEEGIAIQ